MTRFGSDDGSAVTEAVLVIPVLAVLMLFVVFVGRVTSADLDVEAVARDAARAASIERAPAAAVAAAEHVVESGLDGHSVRCSRLDVDVDTSSFAPGGHVAVDIRCAVALSDLAGIGLPGSKLLTARAVEVVDRFRGGQQ